MRRHPIPVVAACIFRGITVLLHKKNESEDERGIQRNPELVGLWELPGGMIEGVESPEEALKREIHEELGIDIDVEGIACVRAWCGKDKKPYILLFYKCYTSSRVVPPACMFVSFEELRAMDPSTFLPREYDTIYDIAKEWI